MEWEQIIGSEKNFFFTFSIFFFSQKDILTVLYIMIYHSYGKQ